MPNKTKAALPGRQCQNTKLKPTQNTTLIDLVNSVSEVFPLSEDNPGYSRSLSLAYPDVSIFARISTGLRCLSAVRPKLDTSSQSRKSYRHLWRLAGGITPLICVSCGQPFESDFKLNEELTLSPELGSWEAFISPVTNPFRNQYKIKPVTAKNTICPLVGIKKYPLSNQHFGSIPRCCSSLRMIRLIHADTEASPSWAKACLIPSSKLGSTRNAICLLPLPLISMVDIWLTPDYFKMVIKCMTGAYQKATPRTVGAVSRRLTKPLSEVTIMADIQSTQTRPEFTWRFFALARAELDGEIYRLSVDATTEQDARRVLAPHFILSLAARLPVRGHHA